jgi:hypothetical protein
MATFDAPSREVCTLRRARSNTPLQALVTLNDPVYIEASQSLARKMVASADTCAERIRHGYAVVLGRPPSAEEVSELTELQRDAQAEFSQDLKKATAFATDPLGPVPDEANVPELAAWTAVANVLLNLDETLMKR